MLRPSGRDMIFADVGGKGPPAPEELPGAIEARVS